MIRFINDIEPIGKRVLLRVDFNVSLHGDYTIADDQRIRQSLPTIKLLLKNRNRITLISHLGRPAGNDPQLSLARVAEKLQSYLPEQRVPLVYDFLKDTRLIEEQTENQVLMLENIRFYEGEKKNDSAFTKALASLGDVYVDDAFAVCHRNDASVVGLPTLLPSYGGLLLEREIRAMNMLLHDPTHPFVALLAGAKISSKLPLIHKLLPMIDTLLLGGGIANTLFLARGDKIGKSICEPELIEEARRLLSEGGSKIVLPLDAIVGKSTSDLAPTNKAIDHIQPDDMILDIGKQTRKHFANIIAQAKTIIWNGPMGYFENTLYRQGSKAICNAITDNPVAKSVVGGGETIAAIAGSGDLKKITWISTGGGAMLEYLEKGTLPGIQALDTAPK